MARSLTTLDCFSRGELVVFVFGAAKYDLFIFCVASWLIKVSSADSSSDRKVVLIPGTLRNEWCRKEDSLGVCSSSLSGISVVAPHDPY